MNIINKQDFEKELDTLLEICKRELRNRESNVSGVGTIYDFQEIISELGRIRSEINTNQIPPQGKRYTSIGFVITDTWPPGNDLGSRLCGIAGYYKRRLR